ncbi:hypothetical protein PAPYR_4563 [Paratrimastix pyriformis]|uniref:Cyclin N-terminal domain-containing protein n=1 Tax=Paratrimastix pyriformis TaxID=342808 RepID=A0ABQ8UJU6_9EUKA|nr:hypothetical protein PAPYR_4563 [Paratrimastix pyriformis]
MMPPQTRHRRHRKRPVRGIRPDFSRVPLGVPRDFDNIFGPQELFEEESQSAGPDMTGAGLIPDESSYGGAIHYVGSRSSMGPRSKGPPPPPGPEEAAAGATDTDRTQGPPHGRPEARRRERAADEEEPTDQDEDQEQEQGEEEQGEEEEEEGEEDGEPTTMGEGGGYGSGEEQRDHRLAMGFLALGSPAHSAAHPAAHSRHQEDGEEEEEVEDEEDEEGEEAEEAEEEEEDEDEEAGEGSRRSHRRHERSRSRSRRATATAPSRATAPDPRPIAGPRPIAVPGRGAAVRVPVRAPAPGRGRAPRAVDRAAPAPGPTRPRPRPPTASGRAAAARPASTTPGPAGSPVGSTVIRTGTGTGMDPRVATGTTIRTGNLRPTRPGALRRRRPAGRPPRPPTPAPRHPWAPQPRPAAEGPLSPGERSSGGPVVHTAPVPIARPAPAWAPASPLGTPAPSPSPSPSPSARHGWVGLLAAIPPYKGRLLPGPAPAPSAPSASSSASPTSPGPSPGAPAPASPGAERAALYGHSLEEGPPSRSGWRPVPHWPSRGAARPLMTDFRAALGMSPAPSPLPPLPPLPSPPALFGGTAAGAALFARSEPGLASPPLLVRPRPRRPGAHGAAPHGDDDERAPLPPLAALRPRASLAAAPSPSTPSPLLHRLPLGARTPFLQTHPLAAAPGSGSSGSPAAPATPTPSLLAAPGAPGSNQGGPAGDGDLGLSPLGQAAVTRGGALLIRLGAPGGAPAAQPAGAGAGLGAGPGARSLQPPGPPKGLAAPTPRVLPSPSPSSAASSRPGPGPGPGPAHPASPAAPPPAPSPPVLPSACLAAPQLPQYRWYFHRASAQATCGAPLRRDPSGQGPWAAHFGGARLLSSAVLLRQGYADIIHMRRRHKMGRIEAACWTLHPTPRPAASPPAPPAPTPAPMPAPTPPAATPPVGLTSTEDAALRALLPPAAPPAPGGPALSAGVGVGSMAAWGLAARSAMVAAAQRAGQGAPQSSPLHGERAPLSRPLRCPTAIRLAVLPSSGSQAPCMFSTIFRHGHPAGLHGPAPGSRRAYGHHPEALGGPRAAPCGPLTPLPLPPGAPLVPFGRTIAVRGLPEEDLPAPGRLSIRQLQQIQQRQIQQIQQLPDPAATQRCYAVVLYDPVRAGGRFEPGAVARVRGGVSFVSLIEPNPLLQDWLRSVTSPARQGPYSRRTVAGIPYAPSLSSLASPCPVPPSAPTGLSPTRGAPALLATRGPVAPAPQFRPLACQGETDATLIPLPGVLCSLLPHVSMRQRDQELHALYPGLDPRLTVKKMLAIRARMLALHRPALTALDPAGAPSPGYAPPVPTAPTPQLPPPPGGLPPAPGPRSSAAPGGGRPAAPWLTAPDRLPGTAPAPAAQPPRWPRGAPDSGSTSSSSSSDSSLDSALAPRMGLDVSTIATAYAYFEELVRKEHVVRAANRRLVAACCVTLAAKFHEPDRSLLKWMAARLEQLGMNLWLPPKQVTVHYNVMVQLVGSSLPLYLGADLFSRYYLHGERALGGGPMTGSAYNAGPSKSPTPLPGAPTGMLPPAARAAPQPGSPALKNEYRSGPAGGSDRGGAGAGRQPMGGPLR